MKYYIIIMMFGGKFLYVPKIWYLGLTTAESSSTFIHRLKF